jgi:aspartate/methionine/tyrosine aminotransferase
MLALAELRGLLDLSQGDLDQANFDNSQTLGSPRLREAIGEWWANGKPDRVMATHGSSEGIFLVMNALLSPGGEVIIISPDSSGSTRTRKGYSIAAKET